MTAYSRIPRGRSSARPTARGWGDPGTALPAWFWVLFGLLLGGALVLRMIDLRDPPLDFNPTRQLYSAIIARAIYYEIEPEVNQEERKQATAFRSTLEPLEPPILETITALTYRLIGSEQIWIVRIFTSVFWLASAMAVFALSRTYAPGAGILVGLAYFLFVPLGVYGSRSFQPDAMMVLWIVLACWALYNWMTTKTWGWALAVGLFGGLGVFTKAIALFFIGGAAAGLILQQAGATVQNPGIRPWVRSIFSALRNPKLWVLIGMIVLPGLLYTLLTAGGNSSLYTRTGLYRWRDLLDGSFYIRWMLLADRLLELPIIFMAVIGALVVPGKARGMLVGLWVGYGIYGLSFPLLIITHDYYHLPMIAIVALSIPPAIGPILERILAQGRVFQAMVLAIGLLATFYPAWIGASVLRGKDFSDAPAYWALVGAEIPDDGKAIGYTQDYGFRLMYYGGQRIDIWPDGRSSRNFEERAAEASYFVITSKNQLSDDLADFLEAHYPVLAEGGGYLIYDLRR